MEENYAMFAARTKISMGSPVLSNLHRWPWIVRLQIDGSSTCGAVIIADHAILTGANVIIFDIKFTFST